MKLAAKGGSLTKTKPFPEWPCYDENEERELLSALHSRKWGTLGPKCREFEKRFADYLGIPYVQTVCNGTVSLEIILRAFDIGEGDEVIIPAYTFIATATAVLMAGAVPVFADVSPSTNLIDPESVKKLITQFTRAVIPVHMAGFPADMSALKKICSKHDLCLIEDSAQAHGSRYDGEKTGTLGDAGSFSFQLSKNMSAGEGGAISCRNNSIAEKIWSIHHVGRLPEDRFYRHHRLSGNYRLSDFQAAVLLAQLGRLEQQIEERERNFGKLNNLLSDIEGISVFKRPEKAERISHHLYMFRYDEKVYPGLKRTGLIELLDAEGIPAVDGYIPLYRQPLFADKKNLPPGTKDRGYSELFLPGVEKSCRETVWLTQNVLLGDDQDIEETAEALKKVLRFYQEDLL